MSQFDNPFDDVEPDDMLTPRGEKVLWCVCVTLLLVLAAMVYLSQKGVL